MLRQPPIDQAELDFLGQHAARRMSLVPWNFGGGLVMSGGAHVLIIIAAVGDSFYSDMPV